MCFSCDDCGYYIANALYICERLASCCAMSAIVTCIITTMLIMLGMGVGLGYNYCFVDDKWASINADPAMKDPTAVESPKVFDGARNSNDPFLNVGRRRRSAMNSDKSSENNTETEIKNGNSTRSFESSTSIMELKPRMVVPLHKSDLLSLITRLVENNKNVTLELIQ